MNIGQGHKVTKSETNNTFGQVQEWPDGGQADCHNPKLYRKIQPTSVHNQCV